MQCDRCLRPAAIHQRYSGLHLCEHHLCLDVTAKAKRVVRAHAGLCHGDRIAVICTGRKSGYALLSFMHSLLSGRRDIILYCIMYTSDQRLQACTFRLCEKLGVECINIVIQEEEFSNILHKWRNSQVTEQFDHAARKYGITKFFLDRTLDDTALFVLIKLLEGFSPGAENEAVFPAITPFMHIPAREVDLYADMLQPGIRGIPSGEDPRERSNQCLEADIKILLDDYCTRHPSTKFALVNLGEVLRYTGIGMKVPTQGDASRAGPRYRREP